MAKAAIDRFPPQVKYIVGNEGCERYSYYGMRSILTVFMVNYLLMQQEWATEVMHIFMAACYLLPILGSTIADRYWGRYKTILFLSLFYCIGHATLAVFESSAIGLYVGLGLIALGAGGIKPCISAFVGDQFHVEQKHLLSKVYSLFYFMINFGSTFSTILTPLTLKYYGPSVAFGIPGVLMGIATLIFWIGRKDYIKAPPSGPDKHSVWSVIFTGTLGLLSGNGFMASVKKKHPAARVEEFLAAMNVVRVFAMVSVFWALFDQHASTWVLQAEKMVTKTSLFGFEFDILSSQMSAINPILVMLMIPVFTLWIYPAIDKFYPMTPLRRMGWGFMMAALGFAAVALVQYPMDQGVSMHILWQSIPYTLMTAAEIMISITGLEFAYTQAPKSIKSTIMSFWFLTVFFGNILTVLVVKLSFFPLGTGNFFMFFAFLIFISGIVFALLVRNYKMRDYMNA